MKMLPTFSKKVLRFEFVFLFLAILCVVLRSSIFFRGEPGFWEDEVWRAYCLLDLGWWKATFKYPSSMNSMFFHFISAPFVAVFGKYDNVFRFSQWLVSVGSFFLFLPVLKKLHFTRWAMGFALLVFAVNSNLVLFAQEFKPYAGDVLAHLLLIYWFVKLEEKEINPRWIVFTILVLMGLFLVSYTILFFFPYIAYFIYQKRKEFFKNQKNILTLLFAGIFFTAYFLIFYHFQLKLNNKDEGLKQFWIEYILGHQLSFSWIKLLVIQSAKFIYYSLHVKILWVFPFLVGGFFFRKIPKLHRQVLGMFLAVYGTLVFASILGKWPIGGLRMNLFIIPHGILVFTIFLQLTAQVLKREIFVRFLYLLFMGSVLIGNRHVFAMIKDEVSSLQYQPALQDWISRVEKDTQGTTRFYYDGCTRFIYYTRFHEYFSKIDPNKYSRSQSIPHEDSSFIGLIEVFKNTLTLPGSRGTILFEFKAKLKPEDFEKSALFRVHELKNWGGEAYVLDLERLK